MILKILNTFRFSICSCCNFKDSFKSKIFAVLLIIKGGVAAVTSQYFGNFLCFSFIESSTLVLILLNGLNISFFLFVCVFSTLSMMYFTYCVSRSVLNEFISSISSGLMRLSLGISRIIFFL